MTTTPAPTHSWTVELNRRSARTAGWRDPEIEVLGRALRPRRNDLSQGHPDSLDGAAPYIENPSDRPGIAPWPPALAGHRDRGGQTSRSRRR